jgi:4-hydroxy-tetrahydrodipicolinate synthase
MPRSRERLSGVWAAMPTPWRDARRIDAGVVAELLRRYKAAGLDGAYATGTDGEMHVLDLPEFRELVDAFSCGIAETGLPAQVGCGWSHTEGVLDRARYAREKGINRIQVAFPSWVTLNDDEILRFYGALQAALPEMEFIHYNIAKSGRFLKGRDYRAILEVAPNLIGSKHTGGDVGALIDVVQATPELDHFVVDGQIVAGALYGARGFYSFIANLSPEYAVRLWRTVQASDWEAAARLHERSAAFFSAWLASCPEISASPALAKIATRAGIFGDMPLAVRAPYREGTERHVAELKQLVETQFPELKTNLN